MAFGQLLPLSSKRKESRPSTAEVLPRQRCRRTACRPAPHIRGLAGRASFLAQPEIAPDYDLLLGNLSPRISYGVLWLHPTRRVKNLAVQVIVNTPIDLKCLTCGKTGIATITSAGPGRLRAVSAPTGFHVRLLPNNSMQFMCSECREAAYEGASTSL